MSSLSLRTQLAWLLSVLSLSLIAAVVVLVSVSFDQGFHSYLNASAMRKHEAMANQLSREINQDPRLWDRLSQRPRAFGRWLASHPAGEGSEPPAQDTPPPPAPWAPGPRPPMPRYQGPTVWLLAADKSVLAGPALPPGETPQTLLSQPLHLGDQRVGYLAWRPVRAIDNDADRIFARQQHQLFAVIALGALALSMLVAWGLSRYLVTPIRQLSAAMRALNERRYDVRVDVRSGNELGMLGKDFNRMAEALGEHDAAQRQWLADISHELRTPLAVLKAELEALEDGIAPLTPSAVLSLSDEVDQLSRLADDLHQLAVTQVSRLRYQLAPLDLNVLLTRLAPRLQSIMHRANLRWSFSVSDGEALVEGDEQRLEQLIVNLAQNSARYTDAGGDVRAHIQRHDGMTLIWEDSAPGVEPADLEHLFDRFYRVEKSRQRAQGGSGLGLAIVANIAQAHGATLEATTSPLGGLRISVRFKQGEVRSAQSYSGRRR